MICVSITSATNKEALLAVRKGCLAADCIELRMDLITDGNLPQLISAARRISPGIKIIVTCRRKDEALSAKKNVKAKNTKTRAQKFGLLREAIILGADFIDIELAEGGKNITKLKNLCIRQGSKTKIIISYHDVKKTPPPTKLKEIFHRCMKEKPAVVKIVTFAEQDEDNLKVLSLIPYARQRGQDIIALCMGDAGRLSRIAAPAMGNFLNFVALETQEQSAPGQLTVREMISIKKTLGEKKAQPAERLQKETPHNFILLGNPVRHSLSPLMHNTALREIGVPETYSACCVLDLDDATRGMKALNVRGASITIPFKVEVMRYLDDIDEDALKIGAVNTIINSEGKLTGTNTDWLGLIMTLKEEMKIKDKTFVIVGAGGTARAAVYGIIKEGGLPILVNRTVSRAKIMAEHFGCSFYPLNQIAKIKADCLINTTPVGMHPQTSKSPVPKTVLKGYKYVMDAVYNPLQTKLLKDAAAQGCRALSGVGMFVHQGAAQLKFWTKKEPPVALMKKIVLERLTTLEQR